MFVLCLPSCSDKPGSVSPRSPLPASVEESYECDVSKWWQMLPEKDQLAAQRSKKCKQEMVDSFIDQHCSITG